MKKAVNFMAKAILRQQKIMEPVTAEDWKNLRGNLIGIGMSRNVYEHKYLADYVIKHEKRKGHFQNIMEYQVWRMVASTDIAKWFAPVQRISRDGQFLMQVKTKPIRFDELPERVPRCFTDFKPTNWGKIDGQPVCHDFGTPLLTVGAQLKKSQFWKQDDPDYRKVTQCATK